MMERASAVVSAPALPFSSALIRRNSLRSDFDRSGRASSSCGKSDAHFVTRFTPPENVFTVNMQLGVELVVSNLSNWTGVEPMGQLCKSSKTN